MKRVKAKDLREVISTLGRALRRARRTAKRLERINGDLCERLAEAERQETARQVRR